MTSTISDPPSRFRPFNVIGIFIVLSLVLPLGVVCWAVNWAFAGKPFGASSAETKIYQGGLKNGELWFSVYTNGTAKLPEWRTKRLDLQTGLECETGITIDGESPYQIWIKDDLYLRGQTAIYRIVDSKPVKIAPRPAPSAAFHTNPFLYDDQLTTVVETDDGGFRLVHLIDGQWANGRGKIRLPGLGRVWYDDPQHDRKELLPLTSEQPVSTAGFGTRLVLQALQQEQTIHLFVTDLNDFCAYRSGFDFADEQSDGVSALSPENSLAETTGWEMIPFTERGEAFACDQHGAIFLSRGTSPRLVRRRKDGKWEAPISLDHPKLAGSKWLHANPTEATAYLVDENQRWSSAVVYRIEEDTVHPSHLTLPGVRAEYLARWQRLFAGLFLAWLLHLAILLGGTGRLTDRESRSHYWFGLQQATLASARRRGFALIVDLLLALTALILLIYMQFVFLGVEWKPCTEAELCNLLFQYETVVNEGLTKRAFVLSLREALRMSMSAFIPRHPIRDALLFAGIAETLALCCGIFYVETRIGFTPGKWLLGIRTVRSTLRPAGFARTLVRNLMYWVDIPFLLTPLPAALSILLSADSQRLGDRVADTIVVNAGSIHATDE